MLNGMKKPKTCLLWSEDDLLGRTVELLLQPDWEVIRVVRPACLQGLIQMITEVNPDAAIICLMNADDDSRLSLPLVQACPRVKIIIISPDTNVVEVYEKRRVQLHQAADLLQVLENPPDAPPNTVGGASTGEPCASQRPPTHRL
jgi:hypothetical protein